MILLSGVPRQLLRTIDVFRGCFGVRDRAPAATYVSLFLGVTHSPALLPLLPPARRGRTLAACKTSLLRHSSATRGAIARPSLLGSPARTTRIYVPSALADLPWLSALVLSLR